MLVRPLLALLTSAPQPADLWYNNPWIIGLATGVASGILLSISTPIFLRRRRAREIATRRERSAEDFLSALRPSVATGNFPSAPVVEAVRRASAYNRGLDVKLAVPAADLLDVLISEVMASSFVSSESRITIVDQLLQLQASLGRGPAVEISEAESPAIDKVTTAVFAGIGACVLGAAGIISVLTKNATLTVIVVSLVISGLATLQFFTKITDFDFRMGKRFRVSMRRKSASDPPRASSGNGFHRSSPLQTVISTSTDQEHP